ncbi:hypothetical protein NDU88_007715 [Pleurodeles waltl]|uniref:Uncharacterized protein n=1 Tax=Pleurodeles waltl TaxID=8319 RepID=A0AAV7U0M1_PLEWA|nr:hypothetical protein NDU88_007715 [Pleurodeles waltl]
MGGRPREGAAWSKAAKCYGIAGHTKLSAGCGGHGSPKSPAQDPATASLKRLQNGPCNIMAWSKADGRCGRSGPQEFLHWVRAPPGPCADYGRRCDLVGHVYNDVLLAAGQRCLATGESRRPAMSTGTPDPCANLTLPGARKPPGARKDSVVGLHTNTHVPETGPCVPGEERTGSAGPGTDRRPEDPRLFLPMKAPRAETNARRWEARGHATGPPRRHAHSRSQTG